jgi:hypothetical protein
MALNTQGCEQIEFQRLSFRNSMYRWWSAERICFEAFSWHRSFGIVQFVHYGKGLKSNHQGVFGA